MTWESSVRTRCAPGACLALVFRGFGRVDAGLNAVDEVAGASFDDAGTTSLPYRSTRRSSRASLPVACVASSSSSGIPPFSFGTDLRDTRSGFVLGAANHPTNGGLRDWCGMMGSDAAGPVVGPSRYPIFGMIAIRSATVRAQRQLRTRRPRNSWPLGVSYRLCLSTRRFVQKRVVHRSFDVARVSTALPQRRFVQPTCDIERLGEVKNRFAIAVV